MTEIMTMKKLAILVPYSITTEPDGEMITSFSEPFRKEIVIRYNRSNWIDVYGQSIKTIRDDCIITSQFYIFV
jgi:hypothetical protein